MQQADDPPSLPVGTEVSAKYKGAFCEAKVSKVVRNIKVKVAYKQGLGSGIVSDDAIKAASGQLRVGAVVEVRHPDRKESVEATITKIQDGSQYTVVFDDGDITTLRRTALCLKSGRHFNESETLDQLPLTHPEHFGNPVVGGRRGRRRGLPNEGSSDDDDESDAKEVVNEKEENIGKVVCVETESKKKDKEKWFPALVVAPTAQVSKQATVRIRVKDEYLVRSFKDGRYYTVPKKEANEFTREMANKQDVPAVQAALEFLNSSILPAHWDRDSLFGLSNLTTDDEGEIETDSSDDEPHEEKDLFVAQLYKYMDDRGTPLNKVPSIQSRDVDLYRLFRAVQKRGGYNRVTAKNQWKLIAMRLGFTPCTISVMNLVKQAYKKFLQPYGDFHRKLGCSMLMTSRNSNRSKGRSLVRANSVASPKPADTSKMETISKLAVANQTIAAAAASATAVASSSVAAVISTTAAKPIRTASTASQSAAEESENTSESSVVVEPVKKQRKASGASTGKVKNLVEKYEDKSTTPSVTATTTITTAAIAKAAANVSNTTTTAAASTTSGTASTTSAAAVISHKDVEADLPLAKIKATTTTRSSIDKDPSAAGSNSTSKTVSETQRSRDVSPTPASSTSTTASATVTISTATGGGGATATTKRDKHQQRKQVDKGDEKRGKRKKDEVTVEKIDTGDFIVGIGDKLKVNYHEKKSPSSHGSTYEAKVIEISVQRGVPMYLVHYTGWNNRYDEWVPRERIAENLTKGSKQKTRTISTSSANSGGAPAQAATSAGGTGMNSAPSGHGNLPQRDAASKGTEQLSGSSVSVLQGVSKTPTTAAAANVTMASGKRGRGRSDSMPPRSTTPSSVASNSSRTKSPATSQLKQKRPTRTLPPNNNSNVPRRISASASISANVSDASIASDTDTDSDEPVRRPKRVSVKEQQQGSFPKATKATTAAAATAITTSASVAASGKKVATIRRPSVSEESDDDEDEQRHQHQQPLNKDQVQATQQQHTAPVQRQRAGNRAMSSGPVGSGCVAAGKGRDYDLSEIRSELKGFQPQPLDRKDAIKSEPSDARQAKQEPKTGSSTEQSSETDSYIDEDSQSSEKLEYRKQPPSSSNDKRPKPTAIVEQETKKLVMKKESDQLHIKQEPVANEERKPFKTEQKEEQAKPFYSNAGMSLIAPARFIGSSNKTAKCTSVIVEKSTTMLHKMELATPGPTKKLELSKKYQAAAVTAATSGDSTKKFVEPVVHKETATLKVELPAACSPSSSSSSSSSFCSSSNNSATTVSISSSSATRSLPDMSKLEISSGTAVAAATTSAGAPSSKETKYSSSNINSSNIASGIKLLSSDVYEFKDTEPFEFEKRISPMAAIGCTSVGGLATAVTPTPASNSNIVPPTVAISATARKQALKANAMQQSIEQHQLPHAAHEHRSYTTAATPSAATPTTTPLGKGKKRGSPLKEATLIASTDKPKLQKVEQQQQQTATTLASAPAAASPNSVKQTPVKGQSTAATPTTGSTQLAPGHATPFDVLRKSPSFNLNMTALNEELAQTVQETTRALTDALQPPTTPSVPTTAATPAVAAPLPTTPGVAVPASPKLSTPPQAIAVAKTSQQQKQHIVGSPFMETRNVFELSTSNEGSGYSSGESNKDNKLEKLENVKILLAGAAGPFDLDAVKYEQKPSSIADKVLKAISQKKEEVEQSKTKTQTDSNNMDKGEQQQELPSTSINIKTEPVMSSSNIKLDALVPLNEPLKIQTSSTTLPAVLSDLYHRTSSSNSPETKSILDAIPPAAKNSELTETIQKLECAIQQRKTPVAGQSLASSTAGTPPVTATAGGGRASFSDESMDSTDSEQRLVIEDVITEEPSTVSEIKSPISENSGSASLIGSVPVKLELSPAGSKQLPGVQAPIPLKPMMVLPTPCGAGIALPRKLQSPIMPTGVPIILPEIPVSVVVAVRHSPSVGSSNSPASPKPESKLTLNADIGVGDGLLLKPYTAQISPTLPDDALPPATLEGSNSSSNKPVASPLSRPYALQPVKEPPMNVSPAASSPLISDAAHSEAAINLLCEETIPGSPAPNYTNKDELTIATGSTIPPAPATVAAIASSSALTISGITPLPPDTPSPRSAPPALISQSAPAASPNSSPESPASQDDSSEETGGSIHLNAVKKFTGLENIAAIGRRKRPRIKASDASITSNIQMSATTSATDLHALGKRRRQQLNSMRKTTTTTAGSDTDDNSDSVVTTQRQSARHQLLPQAQQQQQQQQLYQQQQQQLQQQLPATVNASGVRPCPYNFLVELDPSLSAEQCILILRKQIQDIRKAYNTIKGELAVIDRRRKKLRRREREKKQQQIQSQQQGKICT